jgi:hypothetical protein
MADSVLGLSLREMIHEFRHQTLVLFKCLLLQPKVSLISKIGPQRPLIIHLDVVFRYSMRTLMHDTIFPYFFNTRPYTPFARLRGSIF